MMLAVYYLLDTHAASKIVQGGGKPEGLPGPPEGDPVAGLCPPGKPGQAIHALRTPHLSLYGQAPSTPRALLPVDAQDPGEDDHAAPIGSAGGALCGVGRQPPSAQEAAAKDGSPVAKRNRPHPWRDIVILMCGKKDQTYSHSIPVILALG